MEIPANALVLDAEQWSNPNWKFDQDGAMPRGQGHNPTKQEFGNAQPSGVPFRSATESEYEGKSQLYGNSGIFLMSAYELQVLNSFQNDTFADGSCGSVYGQHPPLVNASKAPGNWQSYDILYKAPVFGTDGSLQSPCADCAPQRTSDSQRCLDLRGSGRSLQITWQTPPDDPGP